MNAMPIQDFTAAQSRPLFAYDEDRRMTESHSRVSRQELYEHVWAEPLTTLAGRYGISDVALAKNCRKLNIPLPGRGYWARKAAGQKVERTPLPELPPNSSLALETIAVAASVPTTAVVVEDASPSSYRPSALRAQEIFEADPKNKIVVYSSLRDPHPLVVKTADAIAGDANHDPSDWKFKPAKRLNLRVTRPALNRALRTMDAILKGFDRRGWNVVIDRDRDDASRFTSYLKILHYEVFFGLREITQAIRPASTTAMPARGPRRARQAEEGSGRLSFVIYEPWTNSPRYEFIETASGELDERLNEVMVKVVASVLQDIEQVAYQCDEWYEQEKVQARQKTEAQHREEEAARVRALANQATRWAHAQQVRHYISAVRAAAVEAAGSADSFPDELVAWLEWAEEYANRSDPLQRPIAELVADRVEANRPPPPAIPIVIENTQIPFWFFRKR